MPSTPPFIRFVRLVLPVVQARVHCCPLCPITSDQRGRHRLIGRCVWVDVIAAIVIRVYIVWNFCNIVLSRIVFAQSSQHSIRLFLRVASFVSSQVVNDRRCRSRIDIVAEALWFEILIEKDDHVINRQICKPAADAEISCWIESPLHKNNRGQVCVVDQSMNTKNLHCGQNDRMGNPTPPMCC